MRELSTPAFHVTWPMFFEAWALLVADFQSEYGLNLERLARDPMFTWRRFAFLALGLLSPPASEFAPATRIWLKFRPRKDE